MWCDVMCTNQKLMMAFNHNYIRSDLHNSDEAEQNKIRQTINVKNDERTQQILRGRNSTQKNWTNFLLLLELHSSITWKQDDLTLEESIVPFSRPSKNITF